MAGVREARIGEITHVAKAIRMASMDNRGHLGKTIFFIGAGCSKSAGIPLATGIAQTLIVQLAATMAAPSTVLSGHDEAYRWLAENRHIRDCCGGDSTKPGARPIEWARVYDALFSDHYTTPDDVREKFAEIVDRAGGFINWAHLCLGELVRKRIVSTVITTNFDQLALSGMVSSGVLPVVCDGIESLSRIRGAPYHPQLVELHGSRHTYRLRNAPDDVAAIANNKPAITAIGSLFQDMRAFVVVGYGGREDGIMDLLINVAEQFADKRLIWVSHDSDPKRLSEKAQKFLATSRNAFALVGQDADSFFLKLLQELEIGAPETVREPLFLANLQARDLATHAPADVADNVIIAAEIARYRTEIEVLDKALARHRAERSAAESALAQARELKLAGKLAQAFDLLKSIAENSDDRTLWRQLAEVASEFGNTGSEIALQETNTADLAKAVAAFRDALKEETREFAPLEWAMTQNNLGNALRSLGERESGTTLLEEAVNAFREALKEYTRERERVPLDWATTQHNLGTALWRLGARESGTTRLEEAVAAFRDALTERTRERVPLDWAATQNNLGSALSTLGQRESGTTRLVEAVAAFRDALAERTRERVPRDWATTQNNLGNALSTLGQRASDRTLLLEAVAAFRDVLTERTREHFPRDWAATQNNLGGALARLGELESDTARLEEAVDAYRGALEVYARERVPLLWAAIQNNLGSALLSLGEREGSTTRIEEAVAAYREALKKQAPDRVPFESAMTTGNQGVALMRLAERRADLEMAQRALAQIETAVTAARERGNAPNVEYYKEKLEEARKLIDGLRKA